MCPAPLTETEFKDVGIVGPENDEDNNEHWHPGQYPAAAPQPPRQSHLPAPPHLRLEDRPSRPAGAGRELLGRRLGSGKARCAALHCLAWREPSPNRCHLWGCATQRAPPGTVGVSQGWRFRDGTEGGRQPVQAGGLRGIEVPPLSTSAPSQTLARLSLQGWISAKLYSLRIVGPPVCPYCTASTFSSIPLFPLFLPVSHFLCCPNPQTHKYTELCERRTPHSSIS